MKMEQSIKIGSLDIANLTEEKEAELLAALQKRIEDRKTSDSEFVIVRAKEAGVFFGVPSSVANGMVILNKCRRLWYWNGASSCSQLARDGADKPDCKFSVRTDDHLIMGVIEMIPCSNIAAKKINAVKEWTA